MKVHVVGNGGREHALRTVIGRTAEIVDDVEAADLVVIGPEQPLVDGMADMLRAQGKLVYGPGADGARLEGSKAFMKEFLQRAGVPTARFGSFSDADQAIAFMRTLPAPYVIKTDGLAAGKGVVVTNSLEEAEADVRAKLGGESFGVAGHTVVIEEGLTGPELSLLYVFDGTNGVALPFAQDFKRIGDNDTGLMTGGVGAYSPVPVVTPEIENEVMTKIIQPTCAQLRKEGIDYRGTLYAGIMLTPTGPKLLEYNVRFGDPETQVVMPRFAGDLAALLATAAAGDIKTSGPIAIEDAAVTVVISAHGYPGAARKGDVITGIEAAESIEGVTVFRAGVLEKDGQLLTNGSRILNVTALGSNVSEARQRAYDAVKCIHFDGMQFRTDIALKASSE